MISYEHALRTVLESCGPLGATRCPLEESLGRIAAEDIRATTDLPAVDRSAMDGYALRSADTLHATSDRPVRLKIVGVVYSSTERPPGITTGRTVAIMTGGALPPGADAIVKEEEVESDGSMIGVGFAVAPRRYVSEKGKDIAKGDLVTKRGAIINPVIYSILASIRLSSVPVMERSAVAVLAIGNELVDHSERGFGQKIVASNLYLLSALLEAVGARVALAHITKNTEATIQAELKEGLQNDLLITTGGTWHSRSDRTRLAMEEAGIRLAFSGISVEPGKGTLFGLFKGKPVFALPGTPAAVFTVFHALIRPCLRKLMGQEQVLPPEVTALLEEDLHRRPGLEHLVTGHVTPGEEGYRVHPVGKPEHPVFSALARTNGFIVVPPDQDRLKRGTMVKVRLLDPTPAWICRSSR